jgi:hypothetical protein
MSMPLRKYIFCGIVWIALLFPSFLFPMWTYYQIERTDGETKIYKYGAPRMFRFSKPPLHIDNTFPDWHGLEKPMNFDAVERNDGWLLLEWCVISIIYVAFIRKYFRSS